MNDEEINDEDPPHYGSTEYWNERYSNDSKEYEWFINWTHFDKFLKDCFCDKTFERALNLGCGSSPLSVESQCHFDEIYNIDISSVVIEQMKKHYENDLKQKWIAMDCLNLDLGNSMFDFVFDKGTLDAIICGDNVKERLMKCLLEIFRVLKPNGCFISVTCGLFMPEINLNEYFQGKQLNLQLICSEKMRNPINKEQKLFLYVLKKVGEGCGDSGRDDSEFIFKDECDHLYKILEDNSD